MKLKRRTFLKTGGAVIASLVAPLKVHPSKAAESPKTLLGEETRGRCPLCSLGCGVVYQSRDGGGWNVEGDPECPVAGGSLCSRGAALTRTFGSIETTTPLYRAPGSDDFVKVSWDEAVHLTARRIKDLRDRDLGLFSTDEERITNRFDSLGVIAGGCLTNEEAYTVSKFFRTLGVTGMDTSVRASHGMAVEGLLDALGFPGATHPVTQIPYSDVVVLIGCNPGQTAPALCRYLDRVRQRGGSVIVLDPRRSETVKKGDLWLQLRPGTDNAILGTLINWILNYAEINRPGLVRESDAGFIVLNEVMGEYERHKSGKNKNHIIVDETLSEPDSVYQRMKKHFERYELERISEISGTDVDLLRRACTLLAGTASTHFSASFVIGSGALASPSGADTVRMAAGIQALLGNLDKKGGGVILPAAAGNAQGMCDMGLLAPYLPGYIRLPLYRNPGEKEAIPAALEALLRSWYPSTETSRAIQYLPHLERDENPSLSTIIQGIGDEQIQALVTIGSDPLNSVTDSSSIGRVLRELNLLVVMDSLPNGISRFWKLFPGRESGIKTEVIFIPTEVPARKDGSMTDPGRKVLTVRPVEDPDGKAPGLMEFLTALGTSIRSMCEVEGGVHVEPILDLKWPPGTAPAEVAAEINGFRSDGAGEKTLPAGGSWQKGDRCGNRLYRGWLDGGKWLADRREESDPGGVGLFEGWGWCWPWGVVDPFSWIQDPGDEKNAYLRRKEQGQETRKPSEVLPLRPQLPVRFWKLVDKGYPFPEHYEPFQSPLTDSLNGGRSNPNIQLRKELGDRWGYLSQRPEEILTDYPVIITMHRTGNVMGTGGITALAGICRELGSDRIVEMGRDLARQLGVKNGDRVVLFSPYSEKGLPAISLVTGRIGFFERGQSRNHITSVTLYGYKDAGANTLTPPVFDFLTGGVEAKVFMGRIEKVKT